jgi:hypothetical protein
MIALSQSGAYRTFLSDLFQATKKESVVDWCEGNVTIPTGAIRGRLTK